MFGKQTKIPTRFLVIDYFEAIQMNFHRLSLSHPEKIFDFFKVEFHVLQRSFFYYLFQSIDSIQHDSYCISLELEGVCVLTHTHTDI